MRLIDADALIDKTDDRYSLQEIGRRERDDIVDALEYAPTIQPEPQEIGYDDCANALLKMWMDNVLTDGEYYRIANKLNVKWGKVELPEPYKGVTE